MGSSTKTVTGMGYSKMFDESTHADLDLMTKKMAKEYAVSKTMDSAFMGQSLLQIRKNFNHKLLDKLDITSIGSGTGLGLTNDSVLLQVKTIDSTALGVDSYTEDTYGCNDDRIEAFMYEEFGLSTGVCNSKLGWDDGGTTVTYGTYDCSTVNSGGDIVIRVNLTLCDGAAHRTIDFPSTNSATLSVTYDTSKTMKIFKDESVVEVPTEDLYLAIDYKLDGELNVEKYITIVNSIMGMTDGTLDETLENDKIEDFFLGYAVEYGVNPLYDEKIDELMSNGGYEVEWNGNSITYGSMSDGGDFRYMQFNGARLREDDDQKVQYMLPLNWLFKLKMREQYDALRDLSTFFVFSSEEVEVEWYQTGFFQILSFLVAIALAAHGMPQMLIMMVASKVVYAIFGDSLIGDVILLAIAISTGGISIDFTSTWSTFTTVTTLAQQVSNIYFKYERRGIQSQIEEQNKKNKALEDSVDHMHREMIYMPLDVPDMLQYTMYDLPNDMYQHAYNYDSYYKLPNTIKV